MKKIFYSEGGEALELVLWVQRSPTGILDQAIPLCLKEQLARVERHQWNHGNSRVRARWGREVAVCSFQRGVGQHRKACRGEGRWLWQEWKASAALTSLSPQPWLMRRQVILMALGPCILHSTVCKCCEVSYHCPSHDIMGITPYLTDPRNSPEWDMGLQDLSSRLGSGLELSAFVWPKQNETFLSTVLCLSVIMVSNCLL